MVQLKSPSVVINPSLNQNEKSNFVKGVIVKGGKGERKADQATTMNRYEEKYKSQTCKDMSSEITHLP